MGRRFITDANGLFTCEIEVNGQVLEEAIEQENADDIFHSVMVMGLAVLAQNEPWPTMLIDWLSEFMIEMREQVVREELN